MRAAIRVRVLYFGPAREAAGTGAEEVSLSEGARVSALLGESARSHPGLRALYEAARVAVNEELADGGRVLEDGDTVALLPPVAGG